MVIYKFFDRIMRDYGLKEGEAIIRLFVDKLGGLRVYVPTYRTFHRMETDLKIWTMLTDDSHLNVVIMALIEKRLGISGYRVRRIVAKKTSQTFFHHISQEMLQFLECLTRERGAKDSAQIVKTLIEELGGLRIQIPTFKTIYRLERDRKIRTAYNGANLNELSIIWGLSVSQIRRILARCDEE